MESKEIKILSVDDLNNVLEDMVNSLLSINYMVLEQKQKSSLNNNQMIFNSNDIFRKGPFFEIDDANVLGEMISYRNKIIAEMEDVFKELKIPELFYSNSHALIDYMNMHVQEKLNYDDFFGDGTTDYDKLEELKKEISAATYDDKLNAFFVKKLYNDFAVFFEQKRLYDINKEIFDEVKETINMFGLKLDNKKPKNPNILMVNGKKIEKFFNEVHAILTKNRPALFKKHPKKNKLSKEEQDLFESNLILIDYLASFYEASSDRFCSANTSFIPENNGAWGFIKNIFITNNKNKLTINEVYVHKKEIENLIDVLNCFPELDQKRIELENLISENKTEEKSLS